MKKNSMEIIVSRTKKGEVSTLGKLHIENVLDCFTLEDKDRGLVSTMPIEEIKKLKVWGLTAMTAGRYKVVKGWWNKKKRAVIHILDVPGFDCVYVHGGNTAKDTDACLLVGGGIANDDFITRSGVTIEKLNTIVFDALDNGEEVWITIS